MSICLRRREFIAGLSGAAAAWPLAARAQQGNRVRRIGVLTPFSANDPEAKARVHALALALQQLGWTDGDNLRIEIRWAGGDASRMRRDAAELVALAPDLIVTTGSATTALALQETRDIPIVFVQVADPVGGGYVESLPRPGGNATGFTVFEYGISGKWLELLKEIAPRVTQVAILCDATIAAGGPAGRNPVHRAGIRRGAASFRRARCRRDRACCYGVRARLERWAHCPGRSRDGGSSRPDYPACGGASPARGLPLPLLRH